MKRFSKKTAFPPMEYLGIALQALGVSASSFSFSTMSRRAAFLASFFDKSSILLDHPALNVAETRSAQFLLDLPFASHHHPYINKGNHNQISTNIVLIASAIVLTYIADSGCNLFILLFAATSRMFPSSKCGSR